MHRDWNHFCSYFISGIVVCLEAEPSVHKEVSLMEKVCWLAGTPENYLETPHTKKGCEEEIHAAVLSHTLSTQPSCLFSQCLFSVAGSSLIPFQHLSPSPTVCTIRGKPQSLHQVQCWFLAQNWGLPHYQKKLVLWPKIILLFHHYILRREFYFCKITICDLII